MAVVRFKGPRAEGTFAGFALKSSIILVESFDAVEGFFDKASTEIYVVLAQRVGAMSGGKRHTRVGLLQGLE